MRRTLMFCLGLFSWALWAQKVGIGTNTPVARLHVEVPAGVSYPVMQVSQQGSAVPFFIIQPNGNVGISVVNPSEALDVSGNVRFSGALMPGGNAGTAGFVLTSQGPGVAPTWTDPATFGDNWGSQVAQTQSPIVGDGTSGSPITLQSGTASGDVLIYNGMQWQIKQAPWDSVCNTALNNMVQKWTGTELCNSQIYDDGINVGIGTTTPSYKLHVVGSVYVQDSLRIDGDFRPGGNPGLPGQVLVSQGPGNPPQWQYLSSPGIGSCVRNVTPCVNSNGNTNNCTQITLSECVTACKNSTYGGFTDWRVPTLEELFCLYREGYSFDYGDKYFWTLTVESCPSPPCLYTSTGYFYIFRPIGGKWYWNLAYHSNNCRCVR